MRWHKHGVIFSPDGSQPWARSHAMIPTPLHLPELGVIRLFFTACDQQGVGRPGFIDVDPHDPRRVVHVGTAPLMDVGQPGTFDENGVLATCVLRHPDGHLLLYYVGFELGTQIRYRLLSGLATSHDLGASFQRHSPVPILERSAAELYFRGGPFVMHEDGRFRMWYVAGSQWTELNGKPMPEYVLKYMESLDGVHWPAEGRVVVDIEHPDEHGFGRPWVMQGDHGYDMFYSIRRRSLAAYRMGYAHSRDGWHWRRDDDAMNLPAGPGDYDDQAIMYAAPIRIAGRTWCFYNGNAFGRDGIALAERLDD